MNPVEVALASQDILHNIFSLRLLSQADLRTCCLVNSDWAAAGLILLWRYPRCHTFLSFRLLLDTLRHEIDYDQPIASTPFLDLDLAGLRNNTHPNATMNNHGSNSGEPPMSVELRRAVTMRERNGHHSAPEKKERRFLAAQPSLSFLPMPLRPSRQRTKEYGIPFHSERVYHRGRFIRQLDFASLGSALSMHHLEVLARSAELGFRSLDLQTVRLPFSEHLLAILCNSKALKQLFLGHMSIPIEALGCLASCFAGLRELRWMNCPDSMGDAALIQVLKNCSQLRILEIHGESFTDHSLSWVAKSCRELETLVIEAPKMTDVVVEQIVAACPNLDSWTLIDCMALGAGTMEALEQRYSPDKARQQHHHHSLAPPRARSHQPMDGLGQHASTSASSSTVSSPSTASISSHSDSEGLFGGSNMHGTAIYETQLKLDRFTLYYPSTPLSSVDLRNCTGIRSQLINQFLKSQTRLVHLTLGGISITDEALESLSEISFPELRSLGLIDCGEISDETMVAVMFNCDELTKLTIFGGTNFTLKTFTSISLHLTHLEELHMEHVPLIMNESIQDILLKCLNLRILRLWHCRNLTLDLFMEELTPCQSLEVLEFMDKFPRPFVEDGWDAQVRFLRSLVIRFEHLRILSLAKLADIAVVPVNLVSYLCQLDQLEKFSIIQSPGMDLTDLDELTARLPTLTDLSLGESDVLLPSQILTFNQTKFRPCVRLFTGMLESSDELRLFVG
ncbi:hypothetical protein EMPS_06080 [Entomortierella parvispora]|uniref:F-box domain-containing protein n=1 Tax=Entomortierella parvispora TaxID=205924 RepID=A0A9P3HBS7_9FUNG|nr:hypothetical protein EMPS_06080 [Entomortierella parvispora]